MAFGEGELPYLLTDMGVTVSVGSSSTKGLVDVADTELWPTNQIGSFQSFAAANIQGKSIAITIITGSLAGLAVGVAVMVVNVAYKVREVVQLDDGAMTKFYCQRTS